MFISKKMLKQILTYLIVLIVIMGSIYMPKYKILAETNTQFSDEKEMEFICNEGNVISPGIEFIENPRSDSVMPFSLMPAEYGNKEKEVYNQGNIGCCWAFAGVSLFEYKVDKVEGVTNTSFSAEHLVEKTSYVGNCGFTPKVKEGGYASMPIAYFVAGYGPVSAEKYPWNNSKELIEGYDFGTAEYRATNVRVIQNERDKDEKITSNVINIVKEAVYNNGAVYSPIYFNSDYMGDDNVSYYVNDKKFTDKNHEVLIVGWNDNWPASSFQSKGEPKVESNGAWLVRNSWGPGFGDNGYFWVSYEDHTIYPDVTICDYERMTADKKVYNLDESGRNGDYVSGTTQQGFINVFDIENKERIKEVTFFESSLTAKCQIFYVPIDSNGIPDVFQKVAISDEVSIPYSGYHTIPVNKDINLTNGTKCGIMVYVKNSNTATMGVEYTIGKAKATLNKGESFLCDSFGNITDFKDKNLSNYGNFSIKLVTEQYDVPISACEVEAISNRRYNGNKKRPTPEITYNGIALTQGKDYTLSYENNVYAGTATVIITGIGNYTGTRRVNFTILKAKISECTVAAITDKRYNGNHKTPTPEITYNGMTLVQGTDYTMSYANNVNAGTATATITGIGNYQGTRTVNYTIKKAKFAEAVISDIDIQYYTGMEIHPTYTVMFNNNKLTLKENVDYTVSYVNCTNAGTATLKLTGKGNYSGTKSVNFTISPASMSGANVYGSAETYTGSEIIHKQTIKYNEMILTEGIDYTVSYADNINAGMGLTKITGINNFTGTRNISFHINPADISNATVSGVYTQAYTGSAETPKPTITFNNMILEEGTDYTLSYLNNVAVGTATMTITGIGNFTGTITKTFSISNDLIHAKVYIPVEVYDLSKPTYVHATPEVKMGSRTLVEGIDYTTEILHPAGSPSDTFYLKITGIGEYYTSTIICQFNVIFINSSNSLAYSNAESNTEFKCVHKPTMEIDGRTLTEGVDYDAYFVGNIYVETSLDTITEINNFNTIQPDIFDISSDETVEIFE